MKTFFALYLLLCVQITFSQNVNTTFKDAQEIKRRTLLLVLPEDSKMMINDYEVEDSSFVVLYKNDMEGQRRALKNVVLKYWTFTDSVRVVTRKEAKSLQKKQPNRYAVMKIGENTQDRSYIHSQPEPPQAAWEKYRGRLSYDYNMRYNLRMLGVTTLVIDLPERALEVYMPKISPATGDFIYAITQINYLLWYTLQSADNTSNKLFKSVEHTSLQQQLSDKTLLLDAHELSCTYDEIKAVYPYPFKIGSYQEIETSLKNRDTTKVTVTASRIDPHRTTYFLSNIGTGQIYYCFTEPTFNYGESKGYAIAVLYPALTASHIRRFGKVK